MISLIFHAHCWAPFQHLVCEIVKKTTHPKFCYFNIVSIDGAGSDDVFIEFDTKLIFSWFPNKEH